VRLVLDEGRSGGPAARGLDLTESSLRNWVGRARADRGKVKDFLLERVLGADGVMRVVMHQKR
jgi:transposase-like protein